MSRSYNIAVTFVAAVLISLLLLTHQNEGEPLTREEEQQIETTSGRLTNRDRKTSSSSSSRSKKSAPAAPPPDEDSHVAGECYTGEKVWWRAARCPPDEHWLEPWVKMRAPISQARTVFGIEKREIENKRSPGGQHRQSGPGAASASFSQPTHFMYDPRKWVLVDVGGNKGYALTSWMEQLLGSANTPFTAKNLAISLFNKTKQFGTMSHCGGCCECAEGPVTVKSMYRVPKRNIKVIAFEPGPATAKHLKNFFSDERVFDIRWKAVSDKSGKAYFPDVPIGKETGHLSDTKKEGGPPMAAVDVVTLDEELAELYRSPTKSDASDGSASPPPHGIDVLTTDVEGFDQDVAKGGRNLLASGRVGVYIFEMNRQENYTRVFSWLHDVAGFECYFGTERRFVKLRWKYLPPLIRITGSCWRPEYETYSGWINAICVHKERARELLPVFGDLTRKRWKMRMTCAGKKQQIKVVTKFLHQQLPDEYKMHINQQSKKFSSDGGESNNNNNNDDFRAKFEEKQRKDEEKAKRAAAATMPTPAPPMTEAAPAAAAGGGDADHGDGGGSAGGGSGRAGGTAGASDK